jgi:nucleoside 2-deoxyribosyltransferase
VKKKKETAINKTAENNTSVQNVQDAGIKSQLHQLLTDLEDSFTGTEADKDLIVETIEASANFKVITEEDRLEFLQAYCRLCKLYMDKFPEGDEIKEVTQIYDNFSHLLYQLYATDSFYYQSIQVLYEYIGQLSKPGESVQAFVNAIQKTTALPSNNESDDTMWRGKALARIIAANVAYNWFLNSGTTETTDDPAEVEFAGLMKYFETHPFNDHEIIKTFERVEELGQKYTGDVTQLSTTLLRIYGIGILLSPQSAPSLEELDDRVVQLTSIYAGQSIRDIENESAIHPSQKTAKDIIDAFTALVKKDGTSVYAFDQAVADIKKLPQGTEEDFQELMNSLLAVCEIGIENALDEKVRGPIQVAKESLLKTLEMAGSEQKPYPIKELKSLLQQDLADLKQRLDKGELPETAITRFLTGLTTMSSNISDESQEGEDDLGEILTLIFKDFMNVIGKYISADQQAVWKEAIKTMGFVTDAFENRDASEFDLAIESKRMEEQGERFINAGLHLPVSSQAMSTPYVMQLLDLYPGLADRFLNTDVDDHTNDKKEFDRLKADLEDTFRLLSSAYTIEQLMQHQKISLRRMSIELSQFERRRYLMLAKPVFPANDIVVDPNRVFFSGTGELVNDIISACNTLGMVLSTKRSVSNQLDSRWSQLRESAVAILDYSGYDPLKADPKGLINAPHYNEKETLEAAGPVAMVAYENGWAYTLGKPVVVITKKGRSIPFDIDIEPVVLEEDGKDDERIISGIQTALYGVNRNTKGSCLEETLDYARMLFKNAGDEKIQNLLNSIKNTEDASRIRFTIEAVLDRANDKNRMVITPAFPGGYPDPSVKKVFHVTGFRYWSKPLEEELKRICLLRGFSFVTGYEKIDPDILPAIFKDITEASFVVTDITNLNPNAVMELAMAQAVGIPVLILTQNKDVQRYFPPVQKTRTHIYDPYASPASLSDLLENFFDGKG